MGKVKVGQADRAALADRAIVATQAAGMQQGQLFRADQAVWMPFHAEVWNSGTQTINNNTATTVAFDTVEADPNSNFASNKYTAPLSGRYLATCFTVFATLTSGAGALIMSAYVGGAETKRFAQYNNNLSGNFNLWGSAVVRANQGQLIDLRILQTSGSASTLSGGQSICWAQFCYLGAL